MRKFALILGVATLSILPAGAAAHADSGTPAKVVNIGTLSTVDSLSPFLAQRLLPTTLHRYMYDFLTNYDPKDDHPIPGLAESWSTSDDKLTWTYKIRSSKWSDGKPVTARDAAWTFNLMMTNTDAAKANGNFVANFKTVTAQDDRTLVIALKQPQATMLALDIPIVPEHVWKDRVADIGKFNNDSAFPIVGNGPFILTGYTQGQSIELSANKEYWRGAPKFDKIVYRSYKDSDALIEALRKGEVDFVSDMTAAQFESLKNEKAITLNKGLGKRFYALAINPGATTTSGEAFGDGNPALRDVRVRQAIMAAIDTKALVAKTLGGYGTPGEGYLPPIWAANHWKPDTPLGPNAEKAGQLLDDAGYKKGANGMRPLTLRLLGQTSRAANADTQNATFIKEWLKAIGVEIIPSIVDSSTQSDAIQAGKYDLAFTSWSTNPDPDYVLSLHLCSARPSKAGGSFQGDNFVCVPAYDDLYAKQLAEYDQAKRTAIVKQMQQQLYNDAYINVLYYPSVLEGYRNDKIASIQKQPEPGGMIMYQDGYWAWWSAAPVATTQAAKGSNTGLVVTVVAVIVVVVAAGAFLLTRRRRSTADERE
jgi:peptide/nickel transport system substrate-binding protein